MGTEILYPRDCLPHSLRHVPYPSYSPFLPRRKSHRVSHTHAHTNHLNANPNSNANPRIDHLLDSNHFNPNSSPNSRPCRKAVPKKRREVVAPLQPTMVMEQVTILKRGQSLDENTSGSLSKEKKTSGSGGVVSYERGGDLIVAERQIRIPVPGIYAGSVCSVSPSPSALPLPTFPMRKGLQSCAAEAAASVDLSATEDLRRLLRLS